MHKDTVQTQDSTSHDAQTPGAIVFGWVKLKLQKFVDWLEPARFRSARWWGHWFNRSIYQSGRLVTLLCLAGLLWVRIEDPELLQFARAKTFDFYQKMKPREFVSNSPVVIVDYDEKSLEEIGQWPWPRTVLADLMDRMTALGVGVISFDAVFPEPDRSSISEMSESIPGLTDEMREALKNIPSNDIQFADAIKRSGRVVTGHTPITQQRKDQGLEIAPAFLLRGKNDPKEHTERHIALLRNLAVLDRAAAGRGVFSAAADRRDGIVRRVAMIISAQDKLFPSLTLETLRVAYGASTIFVQTADYGIERLALQVRKPRRNIIIPTDNQARIWVYYTPHEKYKVNYVSASDVLTGRIDPARIAGKIALIGSSAQGLFDVRASPLDAVLPGVEIHANILENIIFAAQLKRPLISQTYEVLAAIGVGIFMIIVTPLFGARVSTLVFLLIAGSLGWWSWWSFDVKLELYDPVFPVLVALLFYIFLSYAGYVREEVQRKQVRSAFRQYLSPDLVNQLAEHPEQLILGGEMREMTFMFSDVRGFTSISELFDAEGLTRLINRFLTPMTNLVMAKGGTIDKYMGDCIMAFWNAPLAHDDHARDACSSALEMIPTLKNLNEELEKEAKEEDREHRPLNIGIGLNSGEACVGNMGSDQRFDYSVLGDSVNLASRLEGQSKTYGVTIVMGEQTQQQAADYAILELDLIQVKGKTESVRIFTLVGEPDLALENDFLELKLTHKTMLDSYRAQNWAEASKLISAARQKIGGGRGLLHEMQNLYDLYQDRIAHYQNNPPPADWDGTFVATSK